MLVTGAGPVGLLMTAVLKAAGVDDITVSEPAPARRERAAALGATVVTPDELPAAPMGRPVAEPFTLAFECSGRAAACEAALDQLDRAGTFVFLGTGAESPRVNHNRVIILELTLIGSYNYDASGFEAALALLASGRLPLDLLIEPDDVPLDAVGAAMQRLGAGELAGKVMVVPESSHDASFRPRLNHVAISIDPAVLDDAGRADVLAFYGDVFGWTEGDNTGEKGNPLILYTGAFAQFVYLLPATPRDAGPATRPLRPAGVVARGDRRRSWTRAQRFRERDDRVRIIERDVAHHPRDRPHDYTLTSAYIGYRAAAHDRAAAPRARRPSLTAASARHQPGGRLVKSGARFSANAASASWFAGPCHEHLERRVLGVAAPPRSRRGGARSSGAWSRASELIGFAASSRACAIVVSSSSSGGQTRNTRPRSRHSSADNHSELRSAHAARCRPRSIGNV